MIRLALLAVFAMLAVACTSAPAATPTIVDATQSPMPSSVAALPTVTPTSPPSPTLSPTPSPTASPTRAPTPSPAPAAIAITTDLTAPGTLNMDRGQFMALWNEAVADDSLRLSASDWSDEAADGGVTIGQHFFDDPDEVYDTVGVMTVVNADGKLRTAVVLFVAGGGDGLDASMERLIAVFAYSALVDAVISYVPQDTRNEILERLDYPSPSESFAGIDNATSEAGVRFRLVDNGEAIVLIARQDNLSGGSAVLPPTPAVPAPTTSAEYVEFYDGTWEIGVDLEPGTYRTTESTDGCYWERLSGFSGEFDDIIANEFASGYQVVTIKANDVAFESTDCGDWTSDLSAVTETDTFFGEGTFIVGTDVRPGTYRSSGGDGCYWERLSGFGGTFSDIIANDFRDSPATVTIRKSDKGFASNDCGTWTLR